MTKTRIGLEVTEESVRAIEVTLGRHPVVTACGEVALPADAAKDSEVLDRDAVALAVRTLWAQARFRSRNVVLGVGNRRILVREHSSPAMAPALMRDALPFQVQDLLPVPVNQAVLDFYPISESDGQVHGMLVAAVEETIDEIIETIKRAKLVTDAVDLLPFGLARIAGRIAPEGESVAMIHVGEHTTFVVIAQAGIPRFVRILPAEISTAATRARLAQPAEEELESSLDVSLDTMMSAQEQGEDSPRTRRSQLRLASANAQARIDDAAQTDQSISDLVNRIRSTLAYYGGRADVQPVTSVRVSGAGAANPSLTAAIARTTALPTGLVSITDVLPVRSSFVPGGETAFNLVGPLGVLLGEGI